MLTTRLFEEALVRWEHEGKHSAQTFPSKGQEAIAVGTCLALEKGDDVHSVFSNPRRDDRDGRERCRAAARVFSHAVRRGRFARRAASRVVAGARRDAGLDDDRRTPGDGRGHRVGRSMQSAPAMSASAFFGDGTLGSGDLHETMHIAGAWNLPLILVCENNGWEMATTWSKVRKTRSLIPYAEPFGFATRNVDGNDALDVYHAARWARATALGGQPVFLDCMTFRLGLYSSHFGEVRQRHRRRIG